MDIIKKVMYSARDKNGIEYPIHNFNRSDTVEECYKDVEGDIIQNEENSKFVFKLKNLFFDISPE